MLTAAGFPDCPKEENWISYELAWFFKFCLYLKKKKNAIHDTPGVRALISALGEGSVPSVSV